MRIKTLKSIISPYCEPSKASYLSYGLFCAPYVMGTVNPNISNISRQKERPVRSDNYECVPVLSLHVFEITNLEFPDLPLF
jgi:hypothetical protein